MAIYMGERMTVLNKTMIPDRRNGWQKRTNMRCNIYGAVAAYCTNERDTVTTAVIPTTWLERRFGIRVIIRLMNPPPVHFFASSPGR
mmetsp:Transcript_4876/g.7253  ORF Transcript_4876/g.7253 Transcript_4876/m.7253 type:complete len:87 (+) Transcript_4876:974-1234(+)